MDYNTQREKLIMPEYGRHVQKMIEYVKKIKDKDKRNEQIKAVVNVMATLNPQLKDMNDYQRKLWGHVEVISDFDLDIDSPYPLLTKEEFIAHPEPLEHSQKPIKARHYGRNIENMIEVIQNKEEGEVKDEMIKALATYMRQQYLIWNKDSVSEETIFNDIRKLSNDKLIVPDYIHLKAISEKAVFTRPGIMGQNYNNNSNKNYRKNSNNKNSKKHWKNKR